MKKISALVISFNEEKKIEKCLQSLKWCDEIILVDAFSTDQTSVIAKKMGATVFQNKWPGYQNQKNFALSKASHEWILSLDSDEYLSDELAREIKHILGKQDEALAGYELARYTFFLGKIIRYAGWGPEYTVRLFQKDRGRWEGGDPHEYVRLKGPSARLRQPFYHDSIDNLSHQMQKLRKYARMIAEKNYQEGVHFSTFKLFWSPLSEFFRMYFLEQGFRDGVRGFIFCFNYAHYFFLREAYLYELTIKDD